jgi:SAM-dependent methyltransferase
MALLNVQQEKKPWVEFRKGDAESLELKKEEWGSFNLAHARFILEHVRQPEKVVEGMTRAVRSGGKVVLEDDDHELMRLYPSPAGYSELWQAYMRSYDRLGNDPFIGRRLISILHEAGLKNIRNDAVFFGDSAGSPTFQAYARNLVGILKGARELILKEALLDEKGFDAAIQNIEEWSQRPDAALWYTINWAEGTKD